jgi:hypothetical protein
MTVALPAPDVGYRPNIGLVQERHEPTLVLGPCVRYGWAAILTYFSVAFPWLPQWPRRPA